jgi:hypothetical protein
MIVTADRLEEDALRRHDGSIDPRAFAWRAQDIIGVIEDRRGEIGLNKAIDEAMEQFVDPEPNQELKRFAEVVALARRQAMLQEWLDDDRERLHHGHLDHEGLVRVGQHYETLRHEACVYNHKLRAVIETSGHFFSRDDLMGWLVSVSQGRHEWARAELTGAISEVALHAALQGLPELVGLRYGTVEEDLAGYDFITEWQGNLLSIDAKTGRYWPLFERKHGHRHLEVSVPREVVGDDFRLAKHGLNRLRAGVRQALNSQNQGHSQFRQEHPHHTPHHHRYAAA